MSCVGVRKPTSSMKDNALSPFFFKGSRGFNKPSQRSGELLFSLFFTAVGASQPWSESECCN